MAAVVLVTADRLRIVGTPNPQAQHTAVAAAEIEAGEIVALNTNGAWVLGDADTGTYMAWKHAFAGEALTGLRDGTIIDGFDLAALAYGAKVYMGAAGVIDSAGTVEVGEVVNAGGQPHGTLPDKVLKLTFDRHNLGA